MWPHCLPPLSAHSRSTSERWQRAAEGKHATEYIKPGSSRPGDSWGLSRLRAGGSYKGFEFHHRHGFSMMPQGEHSSLLPGNHSGTSKYWNRVQEGEDGGERTRTEAHRHGGPPWVAIPSPRKGGLGASVSPPHMPSKDQQHWLLLGIREKCSISELGIRICVLTRLILKAIYTHIQV